MSKNTYYCITDDDCKYTTMTAEQIVTAIEQAVETGAVTDPDGAVISKIKEIRANDAVQIWKGTQAQFNALSPAPTVGNTFIRVGTDGVLYVCTDDEQMNALLDHIADTSNPHNVTLDQVLNGSTAPDAATAKQARANLGAACGTYSATETDTGSKWIDGKAIYRAVLTGTTTISNDIGLAATLPSAIETPVDIRAYVKGSNGGWRIIPMAYHETLNWSAMLYILRDKVYMSFGSDWGTDARPFVVIVDYTKA